VPFQHAADPARLYDALRRSFVASVGAMSQGQLATRVPASPAWRVVDVLAHVVGITADLNHGRFGQRMTADEWTAAQVETRRGRTVDELAAEWDAESPTFVGGLRALGYSIGAHYLADLLSHVADVRHALGMPRPPDDETLLVATDFYLERFDEALRDADRGAVIITTGEGSFTTGDGDVVAEVHAPRYEAFRALAGRRSERQIRDFDWRGDLDRVLPILSSYRGAPLPERDIVEAP
jgi:uncharacterized protein (TIGR03083 family)